MLGACAGSLSAARTGARTPSAISTPHHHNRHGQSVSATNASLLSLIAARFCHSRWRCTSDRTVSMLTVKPTTSLRAGYAKSGTDVACGKAWY
eukprot:2327033-Rhodomonas_salina.2